MYSLYSFTDATHFLMNILTITKFSKLLVFAACNKCVNIVKIYIINNVNITIFGLGNYLVSLAIPRKLLSYFSTKYFDIHMVHHRFPLLAISPYYCLCTGQKK